MTPQKTAPRLNVTQTPCIGVCSTGIAGSVCRGCKRYAHEVIGWNGYMEEQRRAVYQRLNQLLNQIISDKIAVVDEDKLVRGLASFRVRVNGDERKGCWVFNLLHAGATQIADLKPFGCQVLPAWQHLSIQALYQVIDTAFYELSCAHFERYFER